MTAYEQKMKVTKVNMNDGNGWEGDDGMRQVDSRYSRDDVLELEKRWGLDHDVDRVVRELEARRHEDQQNERDQMELAARRDDNDQIHRAPEKLVTMKKVEKEAEEAEVIAMRRMKLLNIPTTVSFENRKHSRSGSESGHRAKSNRKISKAKTSQDSRGVLIDLTTGDQHESRKESSPLMANDKVEKEEKRQKKGMRDEKNYEKHLQCKNLKDEYARCYPGCKDPNYHLPWRIVADLWRGETLTYHERDIPRRIKDGEKWNKETKYV